MADDVELDETAYNALIYALALEADVDRAEGWLRRMRAKGVAPDLMSYSSVLHACARAGDVEHAEAWVKRTRGRQNHRGQ